MNVHAPDHETMCAALALSNRAPSVHNSQPWQWRVGQSSLHLYARPAPGLSRTDPDGRELMISCGAALHHCTVALAALGWRAAVHRFPNPGQPDQLAAFELHRTQPGGADIALAAAIPRRRTDRRYYKTWPVAMGDITMMGARAARLGVTMRRVELDSEVTALIRRAVDMHLADPGYQDELAAWSGRHASEIGVPARNSPPTDDRSTLPGRVFAGPTLAQPPGVRPEQAGGEVIALGTHDDDDVSRLRAGEAMSAVLLTATAAGLASCPVSEVLEVEETRAGLRAHAFEGREYPQMLVRVGWAPMDVDPLPSTPRRPLTDVVCRLDGSPYL